jgi:predicted NBD/HSP70 family sugar kinase
MKKRNSTEANHDGNIIAPARGADRPELKSVQLASSEIARDINRDIVLELSAIVDQLLEENWIREGAVIRGSRGRPSTMLSVNEDLVTLALDLRPERAILAVVDLSGRFLSRETVMTVSDPNRAIARIVERMQALREQHSDKTFEGIGVSVPGRVHPVTQRLLLAPNLKWHNVDVKAALEEKLGLQVEIDNAANACLLSELWNGHLDGIKNAVLVTISEGIGTAILAGGQLQSGFNGLAGEFGHIPIDPAGPLCGCGQRGCWEMFASSRAALHYYEELVPRSSALSVYQLLMLAEEGDANATKAIHRQMVAFGKGLRLITAALSPEVILITGEITNSWQTFGPIVKTELERTMLANPAPRLVTTGDGDLARLSGGAAMLMQRHVGYHRSSYTARTNKRALTGTTR